MSAAPARAPGSSEQPRRLSAAVATALAVLGHRDGHVVPGTDARVEPMLRAALVDRDRYGATGPAADTTDPEAAGVAAVRTACAFLATGSVEDAYLALQTAAERLRSVSAARPSPPSTR